MLLRNAARGLCVLCICMLLLCAGCEPSGGASVAGAAEPPVAGLPEAAGKAADVTEPKAFEREDAVVLAFAGNESVVVKWAAEAQEAINALLASEGARLRLELRPVDTLDFLDVVSGNDSRVDLFLQDIGNTRSLKNQGYIQDITDAIKAYPALYDITPERAWREISVDGRIYCFPLLGTVGQWSYGMEADVTVRGVFLKRLGVGTPASPDALYEAALEAKERVDESIPHKLIFDLSAPPYALHKAYDEWPFIVDEQSRFILYSDGRVEPYFGSDIFYKDCAFISRCAKAGLLLVDDMRSWDAMLTEEERKTGLAAFYPSYVYIDIDVSEDGAGAAKEDEGIMTINLAPGAADIRMAPCARMALYVPRNCSNVGDALHMLEYLYLNRDINDKLIYGEYGADWVLNEDGSIDQYWIRSYIDDFKHGGRQRAVRNAEFAASKTLADVPGSGFVFDENTPPSTAWQKLSFNDAWQYRAGRTEKDIEGILNELNANGYNEMLDECRRQYAVYIEATK